VGLRATRLRPWVRYEHAFRTKRIRLQFFRIDAWEGQAQGREGQRIAWVDPAAPAVTPVLPSNERVLAALGLPPVYGVTRSADAGGLQALIERLPAALAAGLRLIQVREPQMAPDQRAAFARRIGTLAAPWSARVLLVAPALEARRAGVCGVHSAAADLQRLGARPPVALWAASCHDAADLERAVRLGADVAVLSPVHAGARHADRAALGWDGVQRLAAAAPIPVYAQGGLTAGDAARARQAGAIGVATTAGIGLA
jgi:8-oxo-dGTP diphosphatase